MINFFFFNLFIHLFERISAILALESQIGRPSSSALVHPRVLLLLLGVASLGHNPTSAHVKSGDVSRQVRRASPSGGRGRPSGQLDASIHHRNTQTRVVRPQRLHASQDRLHGRDHTLLESSEQFGQSHGQFASVLAASIHQLFYSCCRTVNNKFREILKNLNKLC